MFCPFWCLGRHISPTNILRVLKAIGSGFDLLTAGFQAGSPHFSRTQSLVAMRSWSGTIQHHVESGGDAIGIAQGHLPQPPPQPCLCSDSRWPRRGESEPPAWTLQANHNACNLRQRIRGSRFRRGGCDREGTTLSEKLAPELAPDRAGQAVKGRIRDAYHDWRCPQKSVQKGVPRDGRGRLSYAFRIGLLSGPRCGRIGAAALSVA